MIFRITRLKRLNHQMFSTLYIQHSETNFSSSLDTRNSHDKARHRGTLMIRPNISYLLYRPLGGLRRPLGGDPRPKRLPPPPPRPRPPRPPNNSRPQVLKKKYACASMILEATVTILAKLPYFCQKGNPGKADIARLPFGTRNDLLRDFLMSYNFIDKNFFY